MKRWLLRTSIVLLTIAVLLICGWWIWRKDGVPSDVDLPPDLRKAMQEYNEKMVQIPQTGSSIEDARLLIIGSWSIAELISESHSEKVHGDKDHYSFSSDGTLIFQRMPKTIHGPWKYEYKISVSDNNRLQLDLSSDHPEAKAELERSGPIYLEFANTDALYMRFFFFGEVATYRLERDP